MELKELKTELANAWLALLNELLPPLAEGESESQVDSILRERGELLIQQTEDAMRNLDTLQGR